MARKPDLNERILIQLVEEGELEIDADGRMWRLAMKKGLKAGGVQIVGVKRRRAEHRTPDGYLQIRAMINGRRVHCAAHRLVWQHFKGDIPRGEEINHDNGLKDDNRPKNLLCGTSDKNVEHAHAGGLIDQHGQNNPAAKLTDNEIAQIRLAYAKGGYTMERLAERFEVAIQHISRVVRGQRRPKQGGPIAREDLRHCANVRHPNTGRFVARGA